MFANIDIFNVHSGCAWSFTGAVRLRQRKDWCHILITEGNEHLKHSFLVCYAPSLKLYEVRRAAMRALMWEPPSHLNFYSFVIVNTVWLGQFKRELWITCFYFARAYTLHYRFIVTDCVFLNARFLRRTFSWWEKRWCAGCNSFQLPPRQDHWHDCDNLFELLRCFARRPNSRRGHSLWSRPLQRIHRQ